ncbi:hypothetical protein KW843_22875 [Acidovorax sp. sif1233]|uniref:hypothetical protein n=1 Tax=Acidovorax sp. sif1233 TaxID=2854792 RepID=UPI001C447129|nr:hypothetical protein [Acidovorax sp. sif1233]MBV7457342.1 hypothetical protein [Acidovorax sp. sif1233]
MSTWYRLDVGDLTQAAPHVANTQRAFMAPYLIAPAGSGRALFQRENAESGMVELFFTPQAGDVAGALGAVPCEKPGIDNGHIFMLAGDDELRTYFPGQQQQ